MSLKRTLRNARRAGLLKNLLIIALLATPIVYVLLGRFSSSSNLLFSRASQSADDFVQTSGYNLKYRGINVVLKGVNFDNIAALAGTVGETSDTIGSGNVEDIYFEEKDYERLSAAGGNHVRFGLSHQWWRDNRGEFYRQLDQQIEWARAHNIWITLLNFTNPSGEQDCYEGYSEVCPIWTNESYQQDLLEFWTDVTEHYRNEPVVVGYDLVNEPTPPGPDWCNTWFDLAQEMIVDLSDVAPNQLFFIEACSDPTFYRVFEDGNGNKATNVVYEVHDYEPIEMTHVSYGGTPDQVPSYPGNAKTWINGEQRTIYFDLDTMLGNRYDDYSTAKQISIEWAKNQQVPIYVGEWGPQGWTENYDQYIRDKATVYNQLGVNHAFYTWRHSVNGGRWWGIYDWDGEELDRTKLEAAKTSWAGAIKPQFGEAGPTIPDPSPSPSPSTAPSPTPGVTPSPTPSPSPAPSPTGTSDFPRSLESSNSEIELIEVQPPVGNEVFIKAEVGAGVNVSKVEWYLNGSWHNRENSHPYFLGGDENGVPKGLELNSGTTDIRAVVYYDEDQHYIDTHSNYTIQADNTGAPEPSPTPQTLPSPTPNQPSPQPAQPSPSPSPTPQVSPSPESTAQPITKVFTYIDIFENWNDGYCARIVINNNTNKEIKNYLVAFEHNDIKFTSKWNGNFANLFGRTLVIPDADTKWLPANGTNSAIDWCADKTGSNWVPTNVQVITY